MRLLALAARAPSPHNIQPACWRIRGADVELWEDAGRWLRVGDPSGRDNQLSLGMAWEGLSLALSQRGALLRLCALSTAPYPPDRPLRLVASGRVEPGACADPLADAMLARRSYRGEFAVADPAWLGRLDACIAAHECASAVGVPGDLARIAEWYDEAAMLALHDLAFNRELYEWMRFAKRGRCDGLSARCLGLSAPEAWAAAIVMRPAVLALLARAGWARFFVSEAGKVKSASRILLVHAAADQAPFHAGQAWYRLWLALTSHGAAGVPMSALVDSPAHAAKVLDRHPLPPGRRLVGAMRIGPAPHTPPPQSARRRAERLLLEEL